MIIRNLDHLVLTVSDIEKTINFYELVLGMEVDISEQGRVALLLGDQKINLHPVENHIEPKAQRPTPGSADLCFIIDSSIDEAIRELKALGISIVYGPVNRNGAMSELLSIYIRDPDANLIELANELEDE